MFFYQGIKLLYIGFAHLAKIHDICYMSLIADLVAVIGTMDIVFGEIDR